jgi:hypothetical protein
MHSNARQWIYLGLAVAGLFATWIYNLEFMARHGGFSVAAFIAEGHANPAASSLSNDLTVAFLAFLVWLPAEARRAGMPRWWVYLLVGVFVAFAVALPLFLLFRERQLARNAAAPA